MKIGFNLNGKKVSVDTTPEKRLIEILREDFGLIDTKDGCHEGKCGTCLVLYNGKITSSCLLPAFYIRNSYIITIEGFSKTQEYSDIVKGFNVAGYKPCNYCISGKILAVYSLLEEHPTPDDITILESLSGNKCICSDYTSLINGVKSAAKIRKRVRNVRKK